MSTAIKVQDEAVHKRKWFRCHAFNFCGVSVDIDRPDLCVVDWEQVTCSTCKQMKWKWRDHMNGHERVTKTEPKKRNWVETLLRIFSR